MRPRRRSLRGAATLAAIAMAGGIAQTGCGSSPSPADPATVTPSSAPLYVSVTLVPSGGPHGDATADAQRLTRLADPYGQLAEALLASEGSRPSFAREIKPWVGTRAGVFLTTPPARTSALSSARGVQATGTQATGSSSLATLGDGTLGDGTLGDGTLGDGTLGDGTLGLLSARAFSSGAARGAIVLDTTSVSRARAFLQARAAQQKAHTTAYRGTRFWMSAHGAAEGIVRGFAVIGSASGMREVIDTSLGGPALAQARSYVRPPSGAIANAYLVPSQLMAATSSSHRARAAMQALQTLLDGAKSINASLTAGAGSVTVQAQLTDHSQPLLGAEGAEALRSLPGGSWLALGTSALHTSLPRLFALLGGATGGVSEALGSLGAGGIGKLLAQLGAAAPQLSRSFARWSGPTALFASGTNVLELQVALAIDSSDAAASRAAVGQLAAIARRAGATVASASIPGTDAAASIKLAGFPSVIYIANGNGKLIVGLGQASVVGALRPATTLASSPSYAAATLALGNGLKPAAIVEFPALLAVLEAIGLAQSPSLSEAVPYLKSLGTLAAGSATTGSETRFRAVLTLAGSR